MTLTTNTRTWQDIHTVLKRLNNEQGQFFLKYASLWARVRNRLKGFLSNTLSTSLVPSYRVSLYLCSFYNRNTGFSFFVYFSLIVSFVFVSYKNRQNGLQLQSSLQNNLPENLYNSARPWFLSSLISLRYTAHTIGE